MKSRAPRSIAHVLGAALWLVVVQACQDGTAPRRVASVSIAGVPTGSLQVGDSVQLSATTGAADGSPLTGRALQWTTTAPAVATVDGTGKVRALTPGTAQIIAASEGAADTVSVMVQQTSAGCTAGGTTLSVGEVLQIDPARDPALCLAPGSGEYTLITFNGQETAPLNLTFEGGSLAASGGDRSRFEARIPFASSAVPVRDQGFEARLRATERRVLPPYRAGVRALRAAGGPRLSRAAAVPAVGDVINLNVSRVPCETPVRKGARVAAVTARAIVVTDTANPAGGFSDQEAREIGEVFDTLVYPVGTENFGEPTDIDGNDRKIIIFYTRAVNELTEVGEEDSYVGGFFFARDLFPATGASACAGSNFAEIFYVLAADPTGAVNGNERSKDFVREVTISTIAHEFEHLINASRRVHVNDAEDFEETWLDEGLAHISEELVYYKASGLGPKQNLNTEVRSSQARFDILVEFQAGNFGRYRSYLEDPENNSPYQQDDDLETRGASWAFLRYAADRVATDQRAFWNRLVNSRVSGFANLRAVLGTEPIPLVRDWVVSVFTDDHVATANSIYQQPSWAFRPLFGAIYRDGFPLRVRALTTGPTAITLAPGGASYMTLTPSGAAPASVRIRSAGVAPPASLASFLVRTR